MSEVHRLLEVSKQASGSKELFIDGSRNLRASNFKDHASSSMHKKAMDLYRRQQGVDIVEYSPIARALVSMDQAHSETVTKVAYMIAKEKLSFLKMQFCELEEKHGVTLGEGCKNEHIVLHLLNT